MDSLSFSKVNLLEDCEIKSLMAYYNIYMLKILWNFFHIYITATGNSDTMATFFTLLVLKYLNVVLLSFGNLLYKMTYCGWALKITLISFIPCIHLVLSRSWQHAFPNMCIKDNMWKFISYNDYCQLLHVVKELDPHEIPNTIQTFSFGHI